MGAGSSDRPGARSRQSGLARALMAIGNSSGAWLLRSPFHGVMSGSVMLVTVTGRKTGRTYTTPVNYVKDGDEITVVSRLDRTWWRNARGGAPVTLRVRGRDVRGTADVVAEGGPEAIAGYRQFRERLGHPVKPEKAEERGKDCVIIRIRLDKGAG